MPRTRASKEREKLLKRLRRETREAANMKLHAALSCSNERVKSDIESVIRQLTTAKQRRQREYSCTRATIIENNYYEWRRRLPSVSPEYSDLSTASEPEDPLEATKHSIRLNKCSKYIKDYGEKLNLYKDYCNLLELAVRIDCGEVTSQVHNDTPGVAHNLENDETSDRSTDGGSQEHGANEEDTDSDHEETGESDDGNDSDSDSDFVPLHQVTNSAPQEGCVSASEVKVEPGQSPRSMSVGNTQGNSRIQHRHSTWDTSGELESQTIIVEKRLINRITDSYGSLQQQIEAHTDTRMTFLEQPGLQPRCQIVGTRVNIAKVKNEIHRMRTESSRTIGVASFEPSSSPHQARPRGAVPPSRGPVALPDATIAISTKQTSNPAVSPTPRSRITAKTSANMLRRAPPPPTNESLTERSGISQVSTTGVHPSRASLINTQDVNANNVDLPRRPFAEVDEEIFIKIESDTEEETPPPTRTATQEPNEEPQDKYAKCSREELVNLIGMKERERANISHQAKVRGFMLNHLGANQDHEDAFTAKLSTRAGKWEVKAAEVLGPKRKSLDGATGEVKRRRV